MSTLSENAISVLSKRYLRKDEHGDIFETPEELFKRVADAIAAAEAQYGLSEEGIKKLAHKYYEMMYQLDFLPNSPTLMNAGIPDGQLSACFVLPIEDSMDGIFETVKNTALIHKSGGGTGFSFSRLRPQGAKVLSTGGVASGPISFMKVFNTATEAVKQGGKRRGANMGVLRIDHPDILEFISCKENNQELTNFNISVGLTEKFMQAVAKNEEYDLLDPRTGKSVKKIEALPVFEAIVQKAWLNGEPGIIFLDRINEQSPVRHLGEIESTNPCGEQPLLPYESCNLGSINLTHMLDTTEKTVDYAKLGGTIDLAVRFLDNVIDVNTYPLAKIEQQTKLTRKIGLGVMGFADLLTILKIPYNSQEAVDTAEELMSFIDHRSKEASMLLAKEKGTFPAFPGSKWETLKMPLRNATTTTIAPTGTISMIAGSSSGIEPLFAVAFYKFCLDESKFPEINPYFLKSAQELDFYSLELIDEVIAKGSLQNIDLIPKDIQKIFPTAHEVSPFWHIKIQSAFQKHTDNAVSKTINFSKNATEKDIQETYLLAYKSNCKGVTVYRDQSREDQVLNTGQEKLAEKEKSRPQITPRYRPEITKGITQKAIIGCGNLYITVNYDNNGICEVFSNLGKGGGCPSQTEATSRLVSLALRSGIDPATIIAQMKGIRCPATISRRSKNKQIKALSCPDAIARSLEEVLNITIQESNPTLLMDEVYENDFFEAKITPTIEKPSGTCPECGSELEHEGGCVLCRSCGYSKCG